MGYRFNPPPGWDLPAGFVPTEDWSPDPAWPPAPAGWTFWLPDGTTGPAAGATATAAANELFRSLRKKAATTDWKALAQTAGQQAKAAATVAGEQARAAAALAAEQGRSGDEALLAKAGPLPAGALWRGVSHDPGKNAVVTLFADRVERVRGSSLVSVGGLLGRTGDVEVIPVRSVASVQASTTGWFTTVTVFASGSTIVFRIDHDEALRFKDLLMDLVIKGPHDSAGAPVVVPAPATPTAPSGEEIVAQIRALAELRDEEIITAEEFETKKAELLARL